MDVAALSLSIDSSDVVKAANDLDQFAAASSRAKAAASGTSKMGQDYAKSARQVDQFSNSTAKLVAEVQRAARFAQYGAANIQATGQASQIAAHHAQNLAFQLNDVAVSLASGQNPMMVFVQQGAQIGQIYSQTGLTLKGFVLGLANMVGIIKTTTAATEALALAEAQQAEASLAAANAQATAAVRAAETNIAVARAQASLATTATEAAAAEARLTIATESLATAQAEAAITSRALSTAQAGVADASAAAQAATVTSVGAMGIALAALAVVLGTAAAGIAALTKQANDDSGLKKYTTAMGYTQQQVEKLNSVTVTYGDTMKAVFQVGWQRIASMFGITTDQLSEKWTAFTDWMVTAIRNGLAGVYAALTGAQNIIPRLIDNIKSGKKESLFELVGGSFADQYRDAQKFMDDVVGQARKNARARQDAMATSFKSAPSAPAAASATKTPERDPWADLLKSADQQQTALEQAGAQIGKYGYELDRLRIMQDLFNQANREGIPVVKEGTIELTAQGLELQRRARIMAETLQNNRVAEFNEALNTSFEKQMALLKQEAGEIGLTGAALAAYRYEQEKLNAAKAVGLDQDPKVREAIKAQGAEYGAQVEAMENARKAIDDQKRAMEENRAMVKGFFTDWIQGVRDGESVFKSFTKAVSNMIDKLIDRLIDQLLNQMLGTGSTGGMSGMGAGGFGASAGGAIGAVLGTMLGKGIVDLFGGLFANGGAFGTAQRYANGGAFEHTQRFANGGSFTNSIVSSPTLFRFAKGTKLGEMGENGPEAIMPLARGSNGKLGVQVHGGTGGSQPSVKMENNVTNVYRVEGAVTPDTIMSMIRQGGEATYAEVRRNLENMLSELSQNGAMV